LKKLKKKIEVTETKDELTELNTEEKTVTKSDNVEENNEVKKWRS